MIVTDGGRFGGYGLFLSKGEFGFGRDRVVFLDNLLDLKRTVGEGPELAPGRHLIRFDYTVDEPGLGKSGKGVLHEPHRGRATLCEAVRVGSHHRAHSPSRERLGRNLAPPCTYFPLGSWPQFNSDFWN